MFLEVRTGCSIEHTLMHDSFRYGVKLLHTVRFQYRLLTFLDLINVEKLNLTLYEVTRGTRADEGGEQGKR